MGGIKANNFRNNKQEFCLNFNSANLDFLSFVAPALDSYVGEWYFNIVFSIAVGGTGLRGLFSGANQSRILIDKENNRILVNSGTSNFADDQRLAWDFDNIYNLTVRRDSNHRIRFSCIGTPYEPNDELLVSSPVQNATAEFDDVSRQYTTRYFSGKIYQLNINGKHYKLNEGSGNILTSETGETMEINTSHVDGIDYINNTMWEEA